MNFDPWTATREEAFALEESYRKSGQSEFHRSPIFQYFVAEAISRSEDRCFEDGKVLLHAVHQCLNHGLVAPPWLARAFQKRYLKVKSLEANSWDDPEVFGPPIPKGSHIGKVLRNREKAVLVFEAVCVILDFDVSRGIDKGTFEEAGAQFGIKATLAEEYYRDQEVFFGGAREVLADPSRRKNFGRLRSADDPGYIFPSPLPPVN